MTQTKLDVLAFAAHPDDAELGAGGTLAAMVAAGKKVGIVDLTRGQLGSRGTVSDREIEAAAATEILGLQVRENLGMEDGQFLNDVQHRRAIIEMIRLYQPDIVLANAVADRHPDHAKGAELVSEAVFQSGLRALPTSFGGSNQSHWRPRAVYHYIQDRYIKPDLVVDISAQYEQKMDAVLAYKTQFYDPESKEPETPISSKAFIQFLESRAREMGRIIGVEFGEGYTCQRAPGVTDLTALL